MSALMSYYSVWAMTLDESAVKKIVDDNVSREGDI